MADNRLPHSKILKILNEPEAADFLKVAVGTLQAWRYLGKGPPYSKLGGGIRGAVRYSLADLQQFVQDTKIHPVSTVSTGSPLATATMTK
jgi:hypothetical protein